MEYFWTNSVALVWKFFAVCKTTRTFYANIKSREYNFQLRFHTTLRFLFKIQDKYGPVVRIHLGTRPNLVIGSSPEAFEKILSSNKQITKVALN